VEGSIIHRKATGVAYVLSMLLLMNGFMPSVLIAILIFHGSMVNSGFRESMFHHCVASAGCLIILTSWLCFSLYHRNNFKPLFANQYYKRGIVGKYQNTILGQPFLLFRLSFSSSPQIGHLSRSSYSGLQYRMQSLSILPHKRS
jgi:hypothetical protein